MRSALTRYLKNHQLTDPHLVNKLIVSAFVRKTELKIKYNSFIQSYLIEETNEIEAQLLNSFVKQFADNEPHYSIEHLVKLFEYVISPADRIVTGAIYTPEAVRTFIVDGVFERIDIVDASFSLADIACGCGGFLLTAARKLKAVLGCSYAEIFNRYLFGLDIEKHSIDRTKILLSLFALLEGEDPVSFEFNLYVGNALSFSWKEHCNDFVGFTAVVGNPPYVCSRNIREDSRALLPNWEVCASGHPDLYIPFFQIGIDALKSGGVLGYITMNSFFKSLNGRALRDYFQRQSFSFIILDFDNHQVFDSKSTYTCLCLIQKRKSDYLSYRKVDAVEDLNVAKPVMQIPYAVLNAKTGWNLKSTDLISKIEAVGQPFSAVYKTRNGIATLKNEVYIFTPVKEDRRYFYLDDGQLHKIERALCKDIVNPNYLTTRNTLTGIKEKLIFPYEFLDDKVSVLSERRLKELYPEAYRYLETKRTLLATRDNGTGKYPKWFAFGRTQSLEKVKHKLFFPHIAQATPNYVISQDEDLFFYNGIAVIGDSRRELVVLRKLMSSRLFWFYLKQTSKPYTSGYISMSKNYIRNFGIYAFTPEDITYIIGENDPVRLDAFFEGKYQIELPNLL